MENGEKFLYRKNLFGDITAIYKGTQKVAEYTYDVWGNCTVTLDTNGYGTRNPIRYRGYYWDSDLNMYYLMTRYYDPKIGRFINADAPKYLQPKTINGLNLYAYCRNNPIMCIDPMGTEAMEDCYRDETDLDSQLWNSGAGFGGGTRPTNTGNNGTNATTSKTEVHHVVEQCQMNKSGFPSSMIQADSNKVVLNYDVHRQISGYYSSKPDFTNGLRVRDWLAGQSFEFQTEFGWQIVRTYRGY